LLRLMLASHSRLIIPPESHFIPDIIYFEKKCGCLSQYRASITDWLIHHKRFSDFGFEPMLIEKTIKDLEPFTAENIITTFFQMYARRENKSRWGDKTPRYRNYISKLVELFPGAKFIMLLRDGRDTALSTYTVPFGPNYVADCAMLWKNSIKASRKGASKIPSQCYMELRYEDLIEDPEKYLKQVCEFLGEAYEPEMLEFHRGSTKLVPEWEKSWHAQTSGSLTSRNIGKWRTQFSPKEIKLIEILSGDELVRNGYALERPRISFGDWLWIYKELFIFLCRSIKKESLRVGKKLLGSGDILKEIKGSP